jgi:hypothetical protein
MTAAGVQSGRKSAVFPALPATRSDKCPQMYPQTERLPHAQSLPDPLGPPRHASMVNHPLAMTPRWR